MPPAGRSGTWSPAAANAGRSGRRRPRGAPRETESPPRRPSQVSGSSSRPALRAALRLVPFYSWGNRGPGARLSGPGLSAQPSHVRSGARDPRPTAGPAATARPRAAVPEDFRLPPRPACPPPEAPPPARPPIGRRRPVRPALGRELIGRARQPSVFESAAGGRTLGLCVSRSGCSVRRPAE